MVGVATEDSSIWGLAILLGFLWALMVWTVRMCAIMSEVCVPDLELPGLDLSEYCPQALPAALVAVPHGF